MGIPKANWLQHFRDCVDRLLQRIKVPSEIYYIGNHEALPPPLTSDEEIGLLERLETGDSNVRNVLIERNLRLVVYIARKFENTGIGIEDLVSIGTIGLIKAVNTFKPARRIKLATYASRCIENEILMHLRRSNKMKVEVSFDEPLNVDWDGNELLLSDVLAPKTISSTGNWRRRSTGTCCTTPSTSSRPVSATSWNCVSGCGVTTKKPRKRWQISWASPSPTSPAWKSGSSNT